MSALIPIITTKGLAAVFNAENTGVAAKITHIALGDNGRTPSKGELGLVNERMRIPIADGERVNDHQIHVTALADGSTEFWVREIGFMLEDGTMLAVWSDKDSPLAYKSAQVPLLLAFDLVLEALPAQSVTVVGTGADLSLAAFAEHQTALAAANVGNMARHVELLFKVQSIDSEAVKVSESLKQLDEFNKKVSDLDQRLNELIDLTAYVKQDQFELTEGDTVVQHLPGGVKMVMGKVEFSSLTGDGGIADQLKVEKSFNGVFSEQCFSCLPVGVNSNGYAEGSELNIGVVEYNKDKVMFNVGRVTGSNPSLSEKATIEFLAIGK